jgi:serine/threonine-protein kinase
VDLPKSIGGKYRPRSVLGIGATGTVYCVEHAFTGDMLALKLMQAHLCASVEAIARFKAEAKMAAKLRSRHVVRIFDAGVARELGGAPYLVMELLEGSNFEQVAGEKKHAPADVITWLRQAAVPLDRAHGMGIVHRDLKLENLFLAKSDHGPSVLKILDFGIARIAESPQMTKSGQLFGTPMYMAPEQARAVPEQVGPAADIYAVGLIAYRLLTGKDYRTDAGLAQMLHEILNEPVVAPSQRGETLGEAFDAWFLRSCDSDPSKRFPSVSKQVDELASALGVEVEGSPVSLASPSLEPLSPRTSWTPPPPAPVARHSHAGSRTSQSGAPASLLPTTLDRATVTSIQLQSIPTLSGADVEEIAVAKPGARRLAIFALCAAMLATGIGFGTLFGWARGAHGMSVAAAGPASCPGTDSMGPVAAAAPVDPGPVEPVHASSLSIPPAPQPSPQPAKAITTAMRPSLSDAARAAMMRTPSVKAPAAPAPKHPADDDPLSDQK